MSIDISNRPRVSVAEWHALAAAADKPTRRKYRNEPTVVDGVRFDSRAEARRWADLELMQRAGRIRSLRRQVPFILVPATPRKSGGTEREKRYVADFVYDELQHDGRTWIPIVEDVKGAEPAIWGLKRALMLHVHGIEVRVVK